MEYYWYLLVGVILGCIATVYEFWIGSRFDRRHMVIEMLLTSALGTIAFMFAFSVGFFSALVMAVVSAIINEIPKWWVRTEVGDEFLDFVAMIPPTIFLVLAVDGFAWFCAARAAAELLAHSELISASAYQAASVDGTIRNITFFYSFVSPVTGTISYVISRKR